MKMPQFPVRARAYVTLVVKPAIEQIVGFNKDGTPRIRRIEQETAPGEIFVIENERVFRGTVLSGYAELVDDDGNPLADDTAA